MLRYWDAETGHSDCYRVYDEKIPDGREVKSLRLRHANSYGGKFNYLVKQGENGNNKEMCQYMNYDLQDTLCIFLCEQC